MKLHTTPFLIIVMILVSGLAFGQVKEKPANPLVGSWVCEDDGTKVVIRANGTLTINGEEYVYKVKNSVINVIGEDGAMAIPFVLEGDKLTVDVEGREMIYKRGKGVGGGSKIEFGISDIQRGPAADPIMQALVGKWCYLSSLTGSNSFMSSRCFVLNANGTYEYSAESSTSGAAGSTAGQSWDSGRWSATRSTLTANSNSGSKTVYPIELRNHPKTGDPMIVVDGDAYVTAYQKRSW